MQHISGLRTRIELSLAPSQSLTLILINALEGIAQNSGLAEVLAFEAIQKTGGYQPQLYSYTPGTAVLASGWLATPAVNALFTAEAGGAGIPHTHIAQMIGRTGRANWPIDSINLSTDELTVTAHGLSNGDRACIRSSLLLPGGVAISGGGYYVNVIDANTIELYSDSALTTKVNITSLGTGDLYLQNCNGSLGEYLTVEGAINAGQTKTFQFTYRIR